MAAGLLGTIRERIRSRDYVMTLHAEAEMDNDELTIYDVESAILTGNIVRRQKDRLTGERKFLLRGRTLEGTGSLMTAVKFGPTGKLVILTVYLE